MNTTSITHNVIYLEAMLEISKQHPGPFQPCVTPPPPGLIGAYDLYIDLNLFSNNICIGI